MFITLRTTIEKVLLTRSLYGFEVIGVLALAMIVCCSSSRVRFSEQSTHELVPADTVAASYAVEDSAALELSDSAFLEYSYIDDALQSELDLAEENYKMGFAATLDSNWLEAQFYFESALEILAGLDIDPESPTLAADYYSRLTNEIISDYKRTLLYIATLPGESSPSAVIARYEELSELVQTDTVAGSKPEPAPDTVVFDIPITWNKKVENCITYFQTIGRKPMEASLARSGRYIPMMEKVLAEEGVPHDLVYLPLIESGFNPKAYSWAHAVGPWQFIASTGRMYGLKRSWWYDDRKDFEKATRAAAQHLRDLYNEAGDWYLALLAYNAGMGNVSKMIRKNNTRDYFKMNIRNREMRNYVPLFLAAIIIAKQPEEYGFQIEYEDPIEFDTVTITRCLTLEDIAKSIGCTYNELKELNPALLRKYTPPDVKRYVLRIPSGKRDIFWATCTSLKSPEETSWVQHQVRKGETVSGIARKYGVSQYAIIDVNNLSRPYRIRINQTLVVPVPLGEAKSYSRDQSRSYDLTGDYYVIRRGDTLWDLAKAFGTSTKALRSLNGLSRSAKIYPGQKIRIPGISSSGSPSKNASTLSYKVRRGDTLWELAQKHGTTVSKLRSINGMSRSAELRIGQIIKIPGLSQSKGLTSHYVVKRGDTLSSIARNFGVSMNNLITWNNIRNPHRLSVGARLRVSAE
jgi:membrane-bound lytic murein transglycosylase D